MRLPARDIARGWLSVAQASGPKDDVPPLARTIAIEEYDHGVRLIATDRYILLTAFIDGTGELRTEPALDELPNRTVIAADPDGRAKNLAGYIIGLTNQQDEDDYAGAALQADLVFDVRVPVGTDAGELTLEGLDPTFVVLSIPDVEKVYLPVVEAPFPDWRHLVNGFTPETTKSIALNPELVERLAKLRKWHKGAPLVWRFGGAERVASIELGDSEPHVAGLVMPMRWELPDEPSDAS